MVLTTRASSLTNESWKNILQEVTPRSTSSGDHQWLFIDSLTDEYLAKSDLKPSHLEQQRLSLRDIYRTTLDLQKKESSHLSGIEYSISLMAERSEKNIKKISSPFLRTMTKIVQCLRNLFGGLGFRTNVGLIKKFCGGSLKLTPPPPPERTPKEVKSSFSQLKDSYYSNDFQEKFKKSASQLTSEQVKSYASKQHNVFHLDSTTPEKQYTLILKHMSLSQMKAFWEGIHERSDITTVESLCTIAEAANTLNKEKRECIYSCLVQHFSGAHLEFLGFVYEKHRIGRKFLPFFENFITQMQQKNQTAYHALFSDFEAKKLDEGVTFGIQHKLNSEEESPWGHFFQDYLVHGFQKDTETARKRFKQIISSDIRNNPKIFDNALEALNRLTPQQQTELKGFILEAKATHFLREQLSDEDAIEVFKHIKNDPTRVKAFLAANQPEITPNHLKAIIPLMTVDDIRNYAKKEYNCFGVIGLFILDAEDDLTINELMAHMSLEQAIALFEISKQPSADDNLPIMKRFSRATLISGRQELQEAYAKAFPESALENTHT